MAAALKKIAVAISDDKTYTLTFKDAEVQITPAGKVTISPGAGGFQAKPPVRNAAKNQAFRATTDAVSVYGVKVEAGADNSLTIYGGTIHMKPVVAEQPVFSTDEENNAAEEKASFTAAPQEESASEAPVTDAPAAGDVMQDGTIVAGTLKGKEIFVAPEDAPQLLSFEQAKAYAEKMNAEKYLGHDDWRVPTKKEQKVLARNRKKGALAETFNKRSGLSDDAAHYWSSSGALFSKLSNLAWQRRFEDGHNNTALKDHKLSVRLVRS